MFKPQSNLWPCKLHHSVTDGTGVQSLRVEAGYLWKQKKSVPRRVRIKELDTDSCGEKNSLSSAAAGEIGPVSILWKLHNAAPGCRDVESVPGEEPSGEVPRCPGSDAPDLCCINYSSCCFSLLSTTIWTCLYELISSAFWTKWPQTWLRTIWTHSLTVPEAKSPFLKVRELCLHETLGKSTSFSSHIPASSFWMVLGISWSAVM